MHALAAPIAPSAPPARLAIELGDARERLVRHRIYKLVNSAARLRRFMESHVFAVWDFQSLLKAMQQRLTCTSVPWVPSADPEARRLVNEIVLDEESDELPEGGSASHFELYLDGMRRAGADTGPIERMLDSLRARPAQPRDRGAAEVVDEAMQNAGAPDAARTFVGRSFEVIESDATHAIVAAFTYGREDVIPEMFRGLVSSLAARDPAWERFHWYLERHIEADDEKHGPICRRIVARLCGDDASRWKEASAAARHAIEARIAFWDEIAADLEAMPSV